MVDDRPPDWDWVKATQNCRALVMFGTLKALAQRDIQTRNADSGREAFTVTEIDGIHFSVNGPVGDPILPRKVFFQVTGDNLSEVTVRDARNPDNPTIYTVGLDDQGVCKFRRDGQQLDAWQVLKASLETLFF